MCEGSTSFRVDMKLHDPLFGSGISCKLTGVPKDLTKLEHGKTVELKFKSTKTGGDEEKEIEYVLKVKRLDQSADQEACVVTRTKSAAEDCGYAPILEEQRQKAAMNKGLGLATPPEPAPVEVPKNFLQQMMGKPHHKAKARKALPAWARPECN